MPFLPLSSRLFLKVPNMLKCSVIYEGAELQGVLNPPIPHGEREEEHNQLRS